LDEKIKQANIEITQRHKTIEEFFMSYLNNMDISVENNNNYFESRVTSLKNAVKIDKKFKMDPFESVIMKLSDGNSVRKNHIAEYKGKIYSLVLKGIEKDLYNHPIIQEFKEYTKKALAIKVSILEISKKCFNSFKDLETTFIKSKVSNGKKTRSSSCTFQKCYKFYQEIQLFSAELKAYGDL